MKIQINKQWKKLLADIKQTRENFFITGKAGTGKSTFLQEFCKRTKKNVVLLAPTGVAAVNIGGQTIHSFFRFGPRLTSKSIKKIPPSPAEMYKEIDVLAIDDINFCDLMGEKRGDPLAKRK